MPDGIPKHHKLLVLQPLLSLHLQPSITHLSVCGSVAIAADRTEGDIMIEGVGEDSGEPEGRAAGVGDGRVERGIGKRRRYWPGGGRDIL